ncbi:hypothetical protein KVV02_003698 [Mortierella alpina]|uniref:Protein BIG1 n=1 Tax=Mortierella alpina TaxID=64518 RepID=A0A9P8D061_MORAP|nr:hypothetical protein KVV02_003698 [Mortierella alpina]
MRTSLLLSFLLASLCRVSAVENTSPFLAWSPKGLTTGSELDTQVISVNDLERGAFNLADCSYKAILVVDEPELHSSDLGRGGRDKLKLQIQKSENSLQIPFVAGAVDLKGLAKRLSQKCDTPLVTVDEDVDITKGSFVMYRKLSPQSSKKNDKALDAFISEIRSLVGDDFLVMYSSSQLKDFPTKQYLRARQAPGEPTPTRQAGIFHHYTFFSQGIFMGLLIAVIVVPIAVMGVLWNLSVQQPQRFEKKQN